MDIDNCLDRISMLWPKPSEKPTKELIDLCLKSSSEYPESSVLWYYLGIVMQLSGEDQGFGPEDYFQCFENAIKYDDTNEEAYQELGYVLEVYSTEYDKAEGAFRKAIELGAGWESYFGRARALAEMGKTDCALDSLSDKNCPYYDLPIIRKLRDEILNGEWNPADI